MSKKFNVTGLCIPESHYMVDISDKIHKIVEDFVHQNLYFTINRARQYGKTTIINQLSKELSGQYIVWSVTFEGLGMESFADEDTFSRDLLEFILLPQLEKTRDAPEELITEWRGMISDNNKIRLIRLGNILTKLCDILPKKIVLIIDEADQACNNMIFLGFLGILRKLYQSRETAPTFQSVILAGVYDIKNLKLKLRSDNEHKQNSPWNIAADFKVDMSFSPNEIATMLQDYEQDHKYGINIPWFSEELFAYTSGYPYLVSRLCQLIDETVWKEPGSEGRKDAWSREGLLKAVKMLLVDNKDILFDDLNKKLADFSELRSIIESILVQGVSYTYNADNYAIQLGSTFGFLVNRNTRATIANRIFETRLYNKFISEIETTNDLYHLAEGEKNKFIQNRYLDMELVLEKFQEHYNTLYNQRDKAFLEREGRFMFLTFLKPIINGVGNYYIEAETRSQQRTDIIVDYRTQQYIIELKIWHGQEYNNRGRKQLFEYLENYHQDTGYLVSFCFNCKKYTGIHTIEYNGKKIVEVII